MKTIRNTTRRPLRVTLRGGRALFLGPGRTGQIADKAVEEPAVKSLLEKGEIELLGEGHGGPVDGPSGPRAGRGASHGFHPPTGSRTRGDR